ncbi:hypothetical protein CPB84DRAFT_1851442 [Gymnopilus junonius]|uniref:Uncharacterized protein n=1 Tax=Gymnopilus junonius TaxID=109634 RepID=A0A9P5NCD5_GYMJU|nr:hypothetical protein CPB84DRAFT_1851442 [Gymnopilus junonius]
MSDLSTCIGYMAADALSMAELLHSFKYTVPSYHTGGEAHSTDKKDNNGNLVPYHSIITSLNMDWIPDFHTDSRQIQVHKDSQFFTGDLSLWPQWFYKAMEYLPYIRARPNNDKIKTHEFSWAWYDMKRTDFGYEEGSAFSDISLLHQDLVDELRAMSDKLRRMHLNCVLLSFAPQTYNLTLFTLTTFQQFFLETLACFEFLSFWRNMHITSDELAPLRQDLVGAVTFHLNIVQELFMKGVPVWLVHHLEDLSRNMTIFSEVILHVPSHLIKVHWVPLHCHHYHRSMLLLLLLLQFEVG